jgi:DMSO/TMAO reductase YedYZ heme-binding membrane subunit
MVLEVTALAILGLFLLRWLSGRSWPRLVGLGLAWHGVHVLIFYAWLVAFDHWLWAHTLAVAGSFALLAILVALVPERSSEAMGGTVSTRARTSAPEP